MVTKSKRSTSSRADSPANLFRLWVDGKPKPIRVGSGRSSYVSCLKYDPASCSWRTYPDSSIGGWPALSVIFPRAGMMRNGIACRRRPLALRTSENGSLSWRTPSAEQAGDNEGYLKTLRDKDGGPPRPGRRVYNPKDGKHIILTRNRQVKMWPTPQVHESGGQGTPSWKDLECQKVGQRIRESGSLIQQKLENEVPLRSVLDEQKMRTGGSLNPTWVEWLMGFPLGWTDLGDSATPSSRRSRSG